MYYSLFLSLVSLYSRGFFEIFFSKKFSYLLEFSLFILFLFVFLWGRVKLRFRKATFIFPAVLLFSVFVSILLSSCKETNIGYSFYVVYFFYVICLYVLSSLVAFLDVDIDKLIFTLSMVVYVLVGIGWFEQLGIIHMPGSSFYFCFVRPSSLTGSYLHYPLILSCLGITLHALEKKLTFPSLLAYVSIFTAFSRSGMFIVMMTLLGIFLYAFLSMVQKRNLVLRKKCILRFLYIVAVLGVFCYFVGNLLGMNVVGYILNRLVSSLDTNGLGNVGRLKAWKLAILKFSETNMLFGEYFGQVTNFTKNLLGQHSIIVESGLLQSLLNVGLIGTVSFYLLFIDVIFTVRSVMFKIFLFAFIFESFVYQSIEVLPVITSIFFFSTFFRSSPFGEVDYEK